MPRKRRDPTASDLELEELRTRLQEAEETLDAIRAGHVDALVVSTPEGDKVYTLQGADHRFRRLVETMNEGAAMLAHDGTVLYANPGLAGILGRRAQTVAGTQLRDVVASSSKATIEALLEQGRKATVRAEAQLVRRDGTLAYVHISATPTEPDDCVALVVTDLTDQKRSQEILASERLASSILDQATEALVVCDLNFRVTRASEGAHLLCGQNPLLRDFREVFALRPVDRSASDPAEILGLAIKGQVIGSVAAIIRQPSGALRDVLLSAGPLLSVQRETLGCVISLTDITEQKRAEEQYRFLTDVMPQMVWATNPDGEFDYANQRWLEYVGKSSRNSEPISLLSALHPEDRERYAREWQIALRTGRQLEMQVRIRRADDAERWHLLRAHPVLDNDGNVTRWVGTCTDVDDQKRAEDAVAFLAKASTTLASSLDVGATLQNLTTVIVPDFADWCAVYETENGAVELRAVTHVQKEKADLLREEFRRYPGSIGVAPAYEKVVESQRALLLPEINDEILNGIARDHEHLQLLREIQPHSAIVVPLSVQQRMLGSMVFGRSAARPKFSTQEFVLAEEIGRRAAVAIDNAKLYESAQRERVRVEEANHAKDIFLATVSHELRTPLTAMVGWTRMLRAGRVPEEKKQHALETIEKNAHLQTQLIEDLLDISRIVSGKLRLDLRRVDLVSVIESAFDVVRPTAEAKSISLQSIIDPRAGCIVGDPDRLQQVVWNLLSNAVKFSPKGSQVLVQLQAVESQVELRVQDQGAGISPEFLPFVFDRFRQADGSITRAHGGLGLGLSIVRHLVELHGGRIEAASDGLGRGAMFIVQFPISPLSREDGDRITPHPRALGTLPFDCPPELEGLPVLVVDDEEHSRELLLTVLQQCKLKVITSASSADALQLLIRERPRVLISDIGMPGEDGYSLIQKVRALPAELGGRTPAVALTAYARVEDRTRALRCGFNMHVPKPIEPAELIAVVANLIFGATSDATNAVAAPSAQGSAPSAEG
jgi:PAS domain S-box-containing protein